MRARPLLDAPASAPQAVVRAFDGAGRCRARCVRTNPDETATIAAPGWTVPEGVADRVIHGLPTRGGVGGVPCCDEATIHVSGIETTIHAARPIGVVPDDVPRQPVADRSFPPTYLQATGLFT